MHLSRFLLLVLCSSALWADTVYLFPPPIPTTGEPPRMQGNDGWAIGRGVEFQMTSDVELSSVGVLLGLTDITISYDVSEIQTLTTPWINRTVLSSGTR